MQFFNVSEDLMALTGAKVASLPLGKGGEKINCVIIPCPQNFITVSEDLKHAYLRCRNWDLKEKFLAKYRENHKEAAETDLPIGQLDVNFKQEDREKLRAGWDATIRSAHPDWTEEQIKDEVASKINVHLGLIYPVTPKAERPLVGAAPSAPQYEVEPASDDDLPF